MLDCAGPMSQDATWVTWPSEQLAGPERLDVLSSEVVAWWLHDTP